jgi:folate-binding protein YgfZ
MPAAPRDPTALHALQQARGASFPEMEGRPLPLGFGDFDAELQAIRSGLGVLALEAWGVLLVRGAEGGTFLNGLVTSNVAALPVGQALHALLCASRGKILFETVVGRAKPEDYLVLTQPGEAEGVAQHLDFYHVRERVQIGPVGLLRLDLLGPGAAPALAALGLAPGTATFGGGPLVAFADPLAALPRLIVLLPPPQAPAFVEALLAAAPGARLVGFEAYDEARIQAGLPRMGPDFGRDHLPGEAGLYAHLSFNKGCYVGQEPHARMQHRGHPNRKLVAVHLPEAAAAGLAAGSPLFRGDEPVGTLTSLARTPLAGERRGIALIRYTVVAEGVALAPRAGDAALVRLFPLATDLGAARG